MKRGVREHEYDGQKGSDAPVHRLSGDEEQEGDDPGSENGRGGDHTGCHRQEKWQWAYLCRSMDCLEKAVKNKGLERSLKVKLPSEVYDALREELKCL